MFRRFPGHGLEVLATKQCQASAIYLSILAMSILRVAADDCRNARSLVTPFPMVVNTQLC
jgi:hypothetical protein